MAKPKNLEQLRAEKEQVETQLAQEQHKLERLENRKKYLEKGERQKRTHRLCNLGGTIESLAPEVKDLTRTEMTELILNIVDGSFFDDYDSSGKELQFKAAATMSVTYTLLERCGFEPEGYFDKDDFQAIHTFSTPDAVYALGAATSDISREVLRKIERTVKTTTRRRNVERMEEYEQQSELHEDRGLPAPEPDPQPAEDPAGQVRQAAPDLPEGAAPGAVPHDADEREPVSASDGGGADGREPDAADHGAASEAEPSPGQSAEPTDVGQPKIFAR